MRRCMTSNSKIVALIVAAGQGSRAGGDIPKQYRRIGGKAVLAHAYDALTTHGGVSAIHIVLGEGEEDRAQTMLGDRAAHFVTGADSRRGSVRAGLEAIAATGSADIVLIHDAARPFLPASVIDRLLAALEDAEGAIPALPVADTLVRSDGARMGDGVDRASLHRVQTPQAFRFETILAAHRGWDEEQEATDDAQILRAWGHDVILVQGDERLEKLTYPQDFARAEARLGSARTTRVGMGYDVHRLASDEDCLLYTSPSPRDS